MNVRIAWRYALAVIAVALAAGLNALVSQWIPVTAFTLPFLAAIALVAIRVGLWPGIVTAVGSLAVVMFAYLQPRYQVGLATPSDWLHLIYFAGVSILVLELVRRLRTSIFQGRALSAERENWLEQIRKGQRQMEMLTEASWLHAAELETVINSMADALIIASQDGTMHTMNPAARSLYGVRPGDEDMLPKDPEGRAKVLKMRDVNGRLLEVEQLPLVRALRGERLTGFEHLVTSLDGHDHHVSVSAAPIRREDGTTMGAVAMLRDITERVEAERALREAYDKLENARRTTEVAYKREHHVATRLQLSLLNPPDRKADGLDIETRYQAGSDEAMVGGDFYDVIWLPEGRIGLVIGDVSGKGIDAAVQMAITKYTVRAFALEHTSPARVLERANDALARDPAIEGFITLFYAVYDPKDVSLTYSNGGHEPPFLCHEGDIKVEMLGLEGSRLLGVTPDVRYQESRLDLHLDDRLFMFTDGFTEARRGDEFLGVEGLAGIFLDTRDLPCKEAMDRILAEVTSFAGTLRDDAAAVLIAVTRAHHKE